MEPTTTERISRTASFMIPAKIEEVFPLFGPVREKDWAEGWDPQIIFTTTGVVDLHMIFKTHANNGTEDFYTWIVSQYRPEEFLIEYTAFTNLRVWFVSVQCTSIADYTDVSVTYTYNGLTATGNELNRRALADIFTHDLRDWQEAVNHFLVKEKLDSINHNA